MSAYRPSARTAAARQRHELDALISRAAVAADVEIQADLVRLYCVRLTGFLEQMCMESGRSLINRMSGNAAKNWGHAHLEKSFNPTKDKLSQFVGRFDSGWKEHLDIFLSKDERGQSLNSLVGIRNQIAHGRSQGVGLASAHAYRTLVDELVDVLLDQFEPA